MRELHGATTAVPDQPLPLKQQALLFDKIHLIRPSQSILEKRLPNEAAEATLADLDFLQERGLVEYIVMGDLLKVLSQTDEQKQQHKKLTSEVAMERIKSKYPLLFGSNRLRIFRVRTGDPKESMWSDSPPNVTPEAERQLLDFYTRVIAAGLTTRLNIETVPVCWHELPASLPEGQEFGNTFNEVLNISFKYFPIPDDTCAWQDIIDFKEELKNKQWSFRHFLAELATKKKTEAAVREEIEYLLNEYEHAMELQQMKASHSFVDVFIITPIEILEDIVKFKWSDILKGGMAARKRKIELMEAEMKAPGRECAYVFDARKRFGRRSG
jgi:hypothetical protein